MRGDKRRGRGAAPAAIEASSRVQSPSLATVALEGKTYTVTPAAVHCQESWLAFAPCLSCPASLAAVIVVQTVSRETGSDLARD